MNQKNWGLMGGIIIVVILIVIFQQQDIDKNPTSADKTPAVVLKETPVVIKTPISTFSAKNLPFPTIIIPNAEQEAIEVSRTAEAFLITLKEKNWKKQYEKLYHEDLIGQVKETDYIEYWQKNLGSHTINLITVEKVDFILEYKIAKLNKTFTNVAVMQAKFLQDDNQPYVNPMLDFIYFAKDKTGYWRFIGFPK